MSEIIFILGGAESGKSSFAVNLLKKAKGKKGFVATCVAGVAGDPEMKIKIKKHKKERPFNWTTFEAAGTPFKLNFDHKKIDSLLIDSLTLWVSSLMLQNFKKEDARNKCKKFLNEVKQKFKQIVIVSDEVGQGIVPENPDARRFRQILGAVNQEVAKTANKVFMITAGIPLLLKNEW
ncbi:MAG: bifunctional adenosylcobinamide kinase/adenosylcobinamide-phosphate guanylyltransferase [Elusimicrobia bacterium]|nr:bifunctional adenosylcobinamide kinase/adenosylcobinamide-phosphate guanylyltransferase [Elusimicrobiota bacterium]